MRLESDCPCGKPMRMMYPGGDPENGPAEPTCPDGHTICYQCGGASDYSSNSCMDCLNKFFAACDSIESDELVVRVSSRKVGPRHDPYHRTQLDVTDRKGVTYRLTSCSLQGNRLEILGPDPRSMFTEVDFTDTDAAYDRFTELVGHTPDVMERYWEEREMDPLSRASAYE